MDRTIILCIVLILCVVLAYFAGKADERRRAKKEILRLKQLLATAQITQAAMGDCLQKAASKIADIQTVLATIGKTRKAD